MSQYKTKRYDNVEDYLKAKAGYDASVQALEELRQKGYVVHLDTELPLPPQGYPEDVIIIARGQIL